MGNEDLVSSMFEVFSGRIATEMQRQEASKHQERLELALEGTSDGLWDWDLVSNTLYLSPRWKEMLGYGDDELPNEFSSWENNVHPDDIEYILKEIEASHLSGGSKFKNRHRMKHKDGDWVWIESRAKTIFDESGKAVRMVGFHTDITENITREQDILRIGTLLNNIMNSVVNLIFVKDENFNYIECNPAFEEFVGKSREDIIGKSDYELFDQELADFFRSKDKEMLAGNKTLHNYEWVTYPDGREVYLLTIKTILRNAQGKAIGLVGNSVDVTKEYQAQYEVSKLKSALERSPVSVVMTDAEGDIVYVNPNFTKVTGYSASEAMGENPRILKSDYMSDEEYVELWKKISSGKVWSGKFKNIAKDGSEFWEETTIMPSINENGDVDGYIAFKLEITDKMLLQKELEKEEHKVEQLGQILDDSTNEVYIFKRDDLRFLYINRGAKENIGYSLREMQELTPIDIKPEITMSKWDELLQPLNSGKTNHLSFSTVHQRKDGTTYPVDIYLQIITYEEVEAYVAIIIDTTEREEIQKQLKDQEEIMISQSRHAAMGEMISMIAHQWRQPISIIAMGANNIIADIDLDILDEKTLKISANDIINQTKELSNTIDDFRNFFRPNKDREKTLVEDIFKDSLSVIGKSLKNHSIEVELDIRKDRIINTFPRELMQVFINMIKNSKEALVENDIKERKILITIDEKDDNAYITVCDNAGGIKGDIIGKIFNPYFSTKNEKNGTGLGLYMSKTIIEKHLYGSIKAYNENGGACFEIKLPYDR